MPPGCSSIFRAAFLRLALALCTLALSAARPRTSELQALLHLYEYGGGPAWTSKENWANDTDPCRKVASRVPFRPLDGEFAAVPYKAGQQFPATPWFGIGCVDPCDDYLDGDQCTAGRITSIRLRANGLSGDLGPSGWLDLGEMRNLTFLDLSYNSLAATLPTEIGLINHLEVLQLRDNSFTGTLPSELGVLNANGIGQLKELSLCNNRFGGHLPPSLSSDPSSLMSLDVGFNSISGTVPASYLTLPALQVLFLRNNSLVGTLPAACGADGTSANGGLGSLRYAEFQGNAFSGTLPPSIGGLTQLFSLDAQGMKISGTLPTELGLLTNLHLLRLNDNKISGSIPSELGKLRDLETLDLFANELTGDMPSELGLLLNLRLLYLPNEQLLPLRLRYCQSRLPNLGKYSYRLVREEYYRMASSICPEPYDTLSAFGTLAQLSGDI